MRASPKHLYRRITLRAAARLLIAGTVECPATVLTLSAGTLSFYCRGPISRGDSVILYVKDMDRFEGTVCRSMGHVFAMRLNLSHFRRERLVDMLCLHQAIEAGLIKKGEISINRRIAPRQVLQSDKDHAITYENQKIPCKITDISLTGVGVKVAHAPFAIGDIVKIGRMRCRVARKTEDGYGFEVLKKSSGEKHNNAEDKHPFYQHISESDRKTAQGFSPF